MSPKSLEHYMAICNSFALLRFWRLGKRKWSKRCALVFLCGQYVVGCCWSSNPPWGFAIELLPRWSDHCWTYRWKVMSDFSHREDFIEWISYAAFSKQYFAACKCHFEGLIWANRANNNDLNGLHYKCLEESLLKWSFSLPNYATLARLVIWRKQHQVSCAL